MISIKPDCKKANALMSGAVDRELSAEEFSYFDQHIEGCETCRNEFELEKLTQTYLKDRVALLDPPDDLLDSIRARLSEVDSVPVDNGQLTRLSSHRYLWPALGIAAVLVFMIISVFTKKSDKMSTEFSQQLPATTTPQTQDALEFSEYDFQTLLKGGFNPQVKTHDADDIIKFLKERAGYSIPLPIIRNADWIGGSVATLATEKVVNVVYKMGGAYIYIYAFPTLLAHSKVVSLSHECIKALDKDEWFWNQSSTGNLQVAWKHENHVCVATSNLDKGELIAYLKTIKGIEDNSWR
ncbi:MAG: anti-sigma factor [Candidatus Kryptoniota bacterium]